MPFQSFAIVPAAGRSVRMGQPKLLLPWDRSTVMETVLQTWQSSAVSQLLVVLHRDDHPLIEVCQRLGVICVIPETPPADMKASVHHGLQYAAGHWSPAAHDVFLIAPADLPLLTAATIDRVLAAHRPAEPRLLLAEHNGQRGHPALFPWAFAAEVASLAENEGINQLHARHPVTRVPCPADCVASDLDTPADYQNLRDRANRPNSAGQAF
jgi:molybdenum cofactor cytidylyltransferase